MPDMLDSGWFAIKIPAAENVDNLLVSGSFSLDEETRQQICSNPDPETAFNVMVRRRRAEVKVSTLSTEKKRELVKAKDEELSTFVKYSVVEPHHVKGSHRLR